MTDVIKNMKAVAGYICMNEFNDRMIVRQEWLPSEGQSAWRVAAAKQALVHLRDYLGPRIKILTADSFDSLAGVASSGASVITMNLFLRELQEGASVETKEQLLKLQAECDEISEAFRKKQMKIDKVRRTNVNML